MAFRNQTASKQLSSTGHSVLATCGARLVKRHLTVRFPPARRPALASNTVAGSSSSSSTVELDNLIEKKSPFDAVRFPSLSRTVTSKRHNGEVDVSRLGHVWGKPGVVGR